MTSSFYEEVKNKKPQRAFALAEAFMMTSYATLLYFAIVIFCRRINGMRHRFEAKSIKNFCVKLIQLKSIDNAY